MNGWADRIRLLRDGVVALFSRRPGVRALPWHRERARIASSCLEAARRCHKLVPQTISASLRSALRSPGAERRLLRTVLCHANEKQMSSLYLWLSAKRFTKLRGEHLLEGAVLMCQKALRGGTTLEQLLRAKKMPKDCLRTRSHGSCRILRMCHSWSWRKR